MASKLSGTALMIITASSKLLETVFFVGKFHGILKAIKSIQQKGRIIL